MFFKRLVYDYRFTIAVGFVMVLMGMLLPLLMVIDMIPTTFFLSLFSHAASVTGLFLGLIGAARYVGYKKSSDENQW